MGRWIGVLALLGVGCANGNGSAATAFRDVGPYRAVENRSEVRVELVDGVSGRVEVTCDGNLVGLIRTRVLDGTLVITTVAGRVLEPNANCEVVAASDVWVGVTQRGTGAIAGLDVTPSITSVVQRGAGTISLRGIAVEELNIDAGSVGDIVVSDVAADVVNVDATSGGEITLSGDSQYLGIIQSGPSVIDATGLNTIDAGVTQSGNGTIQVIAVRAVTGVSSGDGAIEVSGTATVEIETLGGGTVITP